MLYLQSFFVDKWKSKAKKASNIYDIKIIFNQTCKHTFVAYTNPIIHNA